MNTHSTTEHCEQQKVHLPHVEVHVTHACNLRCANCSHYCDIGYSQKVDHDATLANIIEWSKRITVDRFALLGGEPLLEKRVTDYIRTAYAAFPHAERRLVTNGIYLYRHNEQLAELIKDTGTRLIVSMHVTPEGQKEKLAKSLSVLKDWVKKYALNVTIKPIDSRWFKIYHGTGESIVPFTDSNPERSRRHCTTPCINLHSGALWKCPPLAYLPMIINKLHHRKSWEPYLAYRPLQLTATDQQLSAMPGDSHCCDMCPATPKLDIVQKAL